MWRDKIDSTMKAKENKASHYKCDIKKDLIVFGTHHDTGSFGQMFVEQLYPGRKAKQNSVQEYGCDWVSNNGMLIEIKTSTIDKKATYWFNQFYDAKKQKQKQYTHVALVFLMPEKTQVWLTTRADATKMYQEGDTSNGKEIRVDEPENDETFKKYFTLVADYDDE